MPWGAEERHAAREMTIPYHVTGIDHVVIRVRDIAVMLDFYRNVLNCPVERSEESIGLYQLRAGRSMIDLVPVDSELGRMGGAAPGNDALNMDHVCLRVDPWDAEAILAFLSERGVDAEPVKNTSGAEGMGPSIYFNDPEGNRIEIKGPPFPT